MNGSIGYASQEPWIFSASMRENILFGLHYQSVWYDNVIEACALDKVSDRVCNIVLVITKTSAFYVSKLHA